MTDRRWVFASTLFTLAAGLLLAADGGAARAAEGPLSPCHQYYPNIPGEVLLENDKVVVQRFIFPPGQWEGVHAHPPDQLYIHIKGGEWTVRYGDRTDTGRSETGSVGWYGPVSLEADHESVNSGSEPIDLIWVTLNRAVWLKTKVYTWSRQRRGSSLGDASAILSLGSFTRSLSCLYGVWRRDDCEGGLDARAARRLVPPTGRDSSRPDDLKPDNLKDEADRWTTTPP